MKITIHTPALLLLTTLLPISNQCHAQGESNESMQLQRGPLTADQIRAIKLISQGVIAAHGRVEDDTEDKRQIATLAQALDEQIASEESSVAPPPANSAQTSRQPLKEDTEGRQKKLKLLIEKLTSRIDAQLNVPDEKSQKFTALKSKRNDLFKQWAKEASALSAGSGSAARLEKLKKLRDDIKLSRYQFPGDALIAPTPTMTMRSAPNGQSRTSTKKQ